jgi:hypothetical protein
MLVKDGELFFAEFGKVEDCREDFFDAVWVGFNQVADGKVGDTDLSHQQYPNISIPTLQLGYNCLRNVMRPIESWQISYIVSSQE